jgi:hypothetical protein
MAFEMFENMFDQNAEAGKVVGERTIQIWRDTTSRPVRFPPTYPNAPICEWLYDVGENEDGTDDIDPDERYVNPLTGVQYGRDPQGARSGFSLSASDQSSFAGDQSSSADDQPSSADATDGTVSPERKDGE